VIITYKGVVRFTRNISTGGDSLTRAIAQNLGFDFSQAEEYKKTYGIDPKQVDGKVYNSIKPVFDIILNEIKRAYFFYTTHNPSVTIRRVVVCGGSALMPGLLYYLTTNLDLEVELANPWEKIAFPQKLEKDRQRLLDIGPYFVSSVGLAIKEL
jgi:type IV pilus assembly protein PilM